VDHAELINLLPNFGITKSSFKWFKSYLDKRKQKVKINGILGEEMLITCGVPQGSVLGPTLFILYINSICDLDINGQVVTYADDTCLLFSGDTWDNVRTKATLGFKKVLGYLNQRKLTINYKKTNFINFSIHKDENNFDHLKIHNCGNEPCGELNCQSIFRVSCTRYLGLIIDNNLRWNLHVSNIVSRLRTVSFKFYKLRIFLPVHTLRIIYLALYQAILQYGLLVWGGTAKNALQPLVIQQRLIIRICLSKISLEGSTIENFKLFNVLSLEKLYKKIAIFFIIKNYYQWVDVVNINEKRENRAYNAKIPYTKKSFGKKFINYLSPTYFNSLPINIKINIYDNSRNLKKSNLKKLIFNWLETHLD